MIRAILLLTAGAVAPACITIPPPTSAQSIDGRTLAASSSPGSPVDEWLRAEVDAAMAGWRAQPTEQRAVWVGRRLAYWGRYDEAISWYVAAIEQFPESYRLRRHLGHRLITVREIDSAVRVLKEAQELAAGRPNRLEPDGAPGPEAEPRSTTHGNIDYHLALAHYVRGEFDRAAELWTKCALEWSRNDDSRVAALHWAYVSLVRAGRADETEALLRQVGPTDDVIENFAYGELVALYRGQRSQAEMLARTDRSAALEYGLARWLLARGEAAEGERLLRDLAQRDGWTAFGVLAAEADVARMDGTTAPRLSAPIDWPAPDDGTEPSGD